MKYYKQNSLQLMRKIAGNQITPDYPAMLYLDLTEDCNLSCITCRDNVRIENHVMDRKLFERTVDETCFAVGCYSVFNWGESLLLPDFKQRIEYIAKRKRQNAHIVLSTNGMLLNDELCRFLADLDIKTTVSFDASNKILFEQIRRGSNFDRICKNIELLVSKYYENGSNSSPGIYTCIQKSNYYDLAHIVDKANSMCIKRVGMNIVVDPVEQTAPVNHELINSITNAINAANNYGMLVDIMPLRLGKFLWEGKEYVYDADFNINITCDAPLTISSIAWNGDVYLCCNRGAKIENIADKKFKEIWNCEKYKELRQAVNEANSCPEPCKRCVWVNRN